MKTKLTLTSLLIIFLSISIFAQEGNNKKSRTAQVSFFYPIGSNGTNSTDYSNHFSFNIITGINGGVYGAEIGSVLNYNKGDVNGLQISGVVNINQGQSNGVLISGVTNISSENSNGLFLSTANIAAQSFEGLQLGVFNYAAKLNGVQFGIINYSKDASKGIPVGLFNIINNGYYELEITAGEVIYSNINFKMGVEKFYTIYKIGYSQYKGKPVYSMGLGFGSNVYSLKKHSFCIDITANQIVYDNNWDFDKTTNILGKVDLNYKYALCNRISLMIGPSINAYWTDAKVDGEFGTLETPYSLYDEEFDNGKIQMWIGFNAGVTMKL